MTILNFEKMKKQLHGTWIHKLYQLFRYELKLYLKFRFFYVLKERKYGKVIRFVKLSMARFMTDAPKAVAIDIVSCCNLKCPLCSVPAFITKKDDNFMSMDHFKTIVDQMGIADNLSLVYAGEPLLHPEFFDMVDYCINSHYITTITNGTLLNEKNNQKLISSGIDALQISFDGFSKESFEAYRIGANFEKVKSNIINLLEKKKGDNVKLPHVTITYLINAFNEHEVKECKHFFLKAGANKFDAKAINLNTHRRLDGKTETELKQWLPKQSDISLYELEKEKLHFKERNENCSICLTPIIRCDGEVLICCHDIFNTVKIGNLFKENFKNLWRSERYKNIRALAKHKKLPICKACGK